MATKKLSLNAKIFIAIVILLAATFILSGTPQTALFKGVQPQVCYRGDPQIIVSPKEMIVAPGQTMYLGHEIFNRDVMCPATCKKWTLPGNIEWNLTFSPRLWEQYGWGCSPPGDVDSNHLEAPLSDNTLEGKYVMIIDVLNKDNGRKATASMNVTVARGSCIVKQNDSICDWRCENYENDPDDCPDTMPPVVDLTINPPEPKVGEAVVITAKATDTDIVSEFWVALQKPRDTDYKTLAPCTFTASGNTAWCVSGNLNFYTTGTYYAKTAAFDRWGNMDVKIVTFNVVRSLGGGGGGKPIKPVPI